MHYRKLFKIVASFTETERDLFWKPLSNQQFLSGYGSSTTSKHHHSYKGGLAAHTEEVIILADALGRTHECWSPELLIAAAWHDYGKIYDYDSEGVKLPGRDKSSHIKDSIEEFDTAAAGSDFELDRRAKVCSIIASHHGKLEWGSLSVPLAAENKVLHIADYISAITYDLDLNVLHTGSRT
jgi:3'-5' exoribonuclease